MKTDGTVRLKSPDDESGGIAAESESLRRIEVFLCHHNSIDMSIFYLIILDTYDKGSENLTPPSIWEAFGKHLGSIWEAFGSWEAFGKHLTQNLPVKTERINSQF